MKAVLPYNKSVFVNILYPANANEISAYGNSIFLLLLEIIGVIKRKCSFFSSSGKVCFSETETDSRNGFSGQ